VAEGDRELEQRYREDLVAQRERLTKAEAVLAGPKLPLGRARPAWSRSRPRTLRPMAA